MREKVYQKLSYFIGLIPIGAIFGIMAFLANSEVKDFDLWLHLGMGKFITQNGYVPLVDILSSTIAGKEWINHEWLFQVLVYNIYQMGGMNALLLMQTAVVLTTLLMLLILGYNKEKQFFVAVTLVIVSFVYMQRFTLRPDIFSLLFFTLYIFILALHIDKKWSSIALFVIQLIWTNMHGFFFFGPLFILIGIVSEWLKRSVKLPYAWNETGRLTDQEYGRMKFNLLLTAAACLINPHFVKGAWYPLSIFFSISGEHKIFFDNIQELQRPLHHFQDLFNFNDNAHYKLLIIISFITFVFNRRNIDISAFLFWLVFLIFSLKAVRNLAFFSLAAYLIIVTNMIGISFRQILPLRFTEKKFQFITVITLNVMLLFWIFDFARTASMQGYYDFDRYIRKSEYKDVSLKNLPYKAVNFLIENKIRGRFFNDFNSGAYLVGRTYPFIKVFMDGRTEVYGVEFFKNYRSIWVENDVALFDKLVEQYHLTGVFLNSTMQNIPKELTRHVYNSPDWKLVYFDHDGLIFLKNTPENKEWIDRLAFDLKDWKTKRIDLKKVGAIETNPYQNYYRANTLEILNLDDSALSEAKEELKLDTRYGDIYELIGNIYAKHKDFKSAFEYFRTAAILNPSDKNRRQNLAKVYFDMGEYEYAIREYQNIIKVWPQDAKAYFLIARNYFRIFDYTNGMKYLKLGMVNDPKAAGDLIKIGEEVFEQGGFNEAKEIFEILLKNKQDAFMIHRKLAELYKAMGDKEKAKQELNKALQEKSEKTEEMDAVKKELQALE